MSGGGLRLQDADLIPPPIPKGVLTHPRQRFDSCQGVSSAGLWLPVRFGVPPCEWVILTLLARHS